MTSAATTETRTQYGVRKPNGEIAWHAPDAPRYLGIDIADAARGVKTFDQNERFNVKNGRAAAESAMRAKAKDVGVPQEDFVRGHEYVIRQIITITMEPVIVPAPDVEVQF